MYFTTVIKGEATDGVYIFPILSLILHHIALFNFINLIGLF